jgi:hypothetical protein
MVIIREIQHKYLKLCDYLNRQSYEDTLSLEEKRKKKTQMW